LQIDLAQTAVPRDEAELEQRPAVGTVGPSRAAELRTVIYSFQETEEPGMPRGESKLQFTRREMDWEDAHPPLQGAAGGGRRAGGTPRFGAPRGEAGGEDAPVELEKRATEDQPLDDETSITVPEVRDFALRYFDGSAWSTEWDSAARGGLPVAVEVSFDLREVRDAEPAQHAPVADSAVETRSEKPLPPTHRLVIYLPQGGVTRTPVDSAFPMRHPAGRTSADPGSRGNGR